MTGFFAKRAARTKQAHTTDVPLLNDAEIAGLLQQVEAITEDPHHTQEVYYRHAGDFRSAYLGQGLDFEEARLYQQGDDIRNMDWRTTARTGKPHLKIYREEHQPALHIVMDRGASMRFGTETQLKVTQAARIAALFAFAAMRHGACIGGSLVQPGEMTEFTLPCSVGEAGAFRLVEACVASCPPLPDAIPSASLWHTLERLDSVLARGTRLIIISDFQELDERRLPLLLPLLSRLAARHTLVPIQVTDRTEQRLPDVGMMCFRDGVTGLTRWVDTGDYALREAFQHNSQQRFASQSAVFNRIGVRLVQCHTSDDPFALVGIVQCG